MRRQIQGLGPENIAASHPKLRSNPTQRVAKEGGRSAFVGRVSRLAPSGAAAVISPALISRPRLAAFTRHLRARTFVAGTRTYVISFIGKRRCMRVWKIEGFGTRTERNVLFPLFAFRVKFHPRRRFAIICWPTLSSAQLSSASRESSGKGE